jgi:hypothetical protein
MDNAQDIIQAALDSMGTEVTVSLLRPGRPLSHVDGTLTGLATGPADTITICVDGVYTLVNLDHVVGIGPRS